MRSVYSSLIVLLSCCLLSGCSSFSSNVGETTTIVATPAFEAYGKNEEAFGYLADKFRAKNTFTETEASDLARTEGALLSEFLYLQEITTVAGSVPYYAYTESYKRIKRNVHRMKNILDDHIQSYDQPTQIIYYMTRDNIAFIFQAMNVSIAQADADINSKSIDNLLQQFTQLYGAVKPLISTASVLAI